MSMWRSTAGALGAVLLAACGGTTEPATYPEVAGTYQFAGTFDGIVTQRLEGTLVLNQPSRSDALVRVDGDVTRWTSTAGFWVFGPQITDETIRPGQVSREVVTGESSRLAVGTVWRFAGQRDAASPGGRGLRGTFTVSQPGLAVVSGTWTATRAP
jgi:hypothetical protein